MNAKGYDVMTSSGNIFVSSIRILSDIGVIYSSCGKMAVENALDSIVL